MQEENSRIVMGGNFDLNDIPPEGMTRRKYKKRESSQMPSPLPVETMIFGFKLQAMKGLGQQGKYKQGASLWQAVLGSLHVGHGFEVQEKVWRAASQAVNKYNKASKKYFKETREFVFEKNIDGQGNPKSGIGRVGRVK